LQTSFSIWTPFHHHLHTGGAASFHQFPDGEQFFYLGAVRGISQATRTEAVAQAECDIILTRNLE
jgi:hypothetical protein